MADRFCVYCGNYLGENVHISRADEARYCKPFGTCTNDDDGRGPVLFDGTTGERCSTQAPPQDSETAERKKDA